MKKISKLPTFQKKWATVPIAQFFHQRTSVFLIFNSFFETTGCLNIFLFFWEIPTRSTETGSNMSSIYYGRFGDCENFCIMGFLPMKPFSFGNNSDINIVFLVLRSIFLRKNCASCTLFFFSVLGYF